MLQTVCSSRTQHKIQSCTVLEISTESNKDSNATDQLQKKNNPKVESLKMSHQIDEPSQKRRSHRNVKEKNYTEPHINASLVRDPNQLFTDGCSSDIMSVKPTEQRSNPSISSTPTTELVSRPLRITLSPLVLLRAKSPKKSSATNGRNAFTDCISQLNSINQDQMVEIDRLQKFETENIELRKQLAQRDEEISRLRATVSTIQNLSLIS